KRRLSRRKMSDDVIFDVYGVKIRVSTQDVFKNNFDFYYSVYYKRHADSLLNALCDKYGTDKGEMRSAGHPYPWPSHTYADFIERLFDHCREYVNHVFECGLGTNNPKLQSSMGSTGVPGASLRVWREYFPNAMILGADIDKDI